MDDKNKYAEMQAKDMKVALMQKDEEIAGLKKVVENLTKNLDEANGILEADIRGRKVAKILSISDYTVEDLDGMDVEVLDTIESTLKMAKLSKVKPVADVSGGGKAVNSLDDLYMGSKLRQSRRTGGK
jgi:hypothetical protein